MKIVVVASLAFSLVNFRGRLLADMIARGHTVIACAPDDDGDVAAALAGMGVVYRVMPMARAGLNPFVDLRTLVWLTRLFVRERPDVVLAYTQKPIIYAGLASRISRQGRFFAMVSGLGLAFNHGSASWLRRIVAILYRQALARAETVFVFNGDDRAEMLRHRMMRRDMPVIQLPGSGVDLDRYVAAPLPNGPIRFLMIARLLRSKGLMEYAEAARRVRIVCPEVRFALLGPPDPSPDGIGQDQIDAWQRDGLLGYLGEVRDVRPHLAAASVFVLPSWYREGLPRTILEAMATGRAVITTDMPGCREPVEEGVTGYIVPARNVDALQAAMMRFVNDPDLAARMGAQARRVAAERFSVERVNALVLAAIHTQPSGRTQAPATDRQAAVARDAC